MITCMIKCMRYTVEMKVVNLTGFLVSSPSQGFLSGFDCIILRIGLDFEVEL